MKRKYELVEIEKLVPYSRNARKHSKEQIKKIQASIREFGFINPVLIDGKLGIIAGHGRVEAARLEGMDKVPCLFIEDLSETQKKAYILADNKLHEYATWDEDLLAIELEELQNLDFNIELTGFNIADFKDLFPEAEVVEDDFEVELPEEPKAKLGDIYQLGNHRLMCGDSTKEEDVAALMNGNKADMVFTDPPYGMEYQSNMRTKTSRFEELKNDDSILDFFKVVKQHVVGFVFVCTTWKVLGEWMKLFEKYYEITNMIIWDKGGGGIGDLEKTFVTDYEMILVSNAGNKITGKRLGSVWSIGKDSANKYIHATQKPVELSHTAIINTTHAKNIVIDLFGGSGSTLIACEQLDRKCYMMELDPKYIDVIIKRWEIFTGEEAVKL